MYSEHDHNKPIEAHHFEWFLPTPPKPILMLTVSREGEISLNGKLCETLPKRLQIGVNKDGRNLGLTEHANGGFCVPKNGRIKASNLVKAIEKRGISLPAKYTVEKINGLWIATILPDVPPTNVRRTPKKPRHNGLKAMLPSKGLK